MFNLEVVLLYKTDIIPITINFAILRFSISKYYLLEQIIDRIVTSLMKESYFCKFASIAGLLRIGIKYNWLSHFNVDQLLLPELSASPCPQKFMALAPPHLSALVLAYSILKDLIYSSL